MPQSSREIVKRCLTFNFPERIPRDLWILPWAKIHHPQAVAEITRRFPNDIVTTDYSGSPSSLGKSDRYKVGYFTDEWGCVFRNILEGAIGEVETPVLQDIADWKSIKPPYELLPTDTNKAYDTISRFYDQTDRFVLANCCPRPWERYQFLRGAENAMIDMMMPDDGPVELMKVIHDFYLKELEFWVKSDVDAVWFMDDWGAQDRLLIQPSLWRELFKPLYRDYCDLAKAYDKFVFMHSDGNISDIFEDLVEVGIDAVNSQLFCMDMAELAKRVKGKITFWGEIDRQFILPSEDTQAGREAVRKVVSHLHSQSGGIIAQLEFGLMANPDTVVAVLEEWDGK
ncbi:MAG: uroporphyrinogen decarboxylase family protein [Candidatus Hatepunaea meridiana]|nr:uroporphyrinogen decarboxylase family protein [Candidatus Hatepunaea meridiana]